MIALGDTVKDRVTGLTGIAVSRHEYLHGCIRFTVQPVEIKDGKPVESSTFDEPGLEIVTRGPALAAKGSNEPGGPRTEPSRPSVPAR